MSDRRQESYAIRLEAAELARSREHPHHQANGDEQRYAGDQYFMSFTKGLPHNPDTGLLQDAQDFVEFRRAIDDAFIDPFSDRVRHGARYKVENGKVVDKLDSTDPEDVVNLKDFRQWEAPTAGVVFELQGPDAQSVTMPPAPPLLNTSGNVNAELVLEMAEVYELAVLRDEPFNDLEAGKTNSKVLKSIKRLNALPYISKQTGRPRKVNSQGKLDLQTAFRGSSPGVEIGSYLSQFLLIGNIDRNKRGSVAEGKIAYGSLQVNQKVAIAEPHENYMLSMDDYIKVQRGIKPVNPENYVPEPNPPAGVSPRPARRFISTPRDLATYVHYDALYEAYLNACIILLEMKTPFDPSFDHLSGVGAASGSAITRRNAGGFALYGGPHILNLVTEVATRALKAVRFQKFNNHIRLRPEALASRIELVRLHSAKSLPSGTYVPPSLVDDIGSFKKELEKNKDSDGNSTLSEIMSGPGNNTHTVLLPMAFPEGSPMHPSYGAGHATVAGACVTVLKAFFDTSAVLAQTGTGTVAFKRQESGDKAIAFRAPDLPGFPTGDLISHIPKQFLTLEGELNKLAANIAIGRNMAGVHYFADYYNSIRMGEKIAIGILEEQALTYLTDPFVLSVPTFDGTVVRIGRR